MKRYALAAILPVVLAVVLAGCGDDSTTTTAGAAGGSATTTTAAGTTTSAATAGSDAATTAPAGGGPTVKIADSPLGRILVDGAGHTLYVFMPDTATTSACTGGCATAWPPLPGPATGDGVGADDLGTITRDDGSKQATFYGHPVYAYASDSAPGDTTGQGVGGKWYVVDADGNPVTGSAAATTTTGRYGY
ncbi:MAG: hypothetical protein U0Q22_04775 [Acidimicrobiales bacterium]